MNIKEIIIKIRDRIINKDNWCQGAWARDEYFHNVSPSNPKACKFCLATSLNMCKLDCEDADLILDEFYKEFKIMEKPLNIIKFNDGSEHSDIVDFLNRIIARQA